MSLKKSVLFNCDPLKLFPPHLMLYCVYLYNIFVCTCSRLRHSPIWNPDGLSVACHIDVLQSSERWPISSTAPLGITPWMHATRWIRVRVREMVQTLRENPVIVQLKSECGSFWTSAGTMQLGMRGIPVLEEYRYILYFKWYDIIILLNSVFHILLPKLLHNF